MHINQLLFADDTALVADSEEKLRRLVGWVGLVYESECSSEESYEVLDVSKNMAGMYLRLNDEP